MTHRSIGTSSAVRALRPGRSARPRAAAMLADGNVYVSSGAMRYPARPMSGSTGRGTLRVVPELEETSPYPETLPVPTDPIIGRTSEVERGLRLIDGGGRLITITGPAGVGKTRLGVELAGKLADTIGRAVIYVE